MYSKYKKAYDDAEYLPLTPSDSDENRFIYKFNSVEHFLGYTEYLNKNFKRGSYQNSSEARNPDENGWYASSSFEDALQRIRGIEFDPSAVSRLQQRIRSVRRTSRFSDDGYEIDMPEALAKSERMWLQTDTRRSISRIFDETLFINASYNSDVRAETARKAGLALLEEIYLKGIIPRKVVCVFWSEKVIPRSNDMDGATPIFIDVSFRDLNGIAKTLHPATFRRMVFRIEEIFSDLNGGYGRHEDRPTEKGLTEIASLVGGSVSAHVNTLLGLNKAAV